MFGFYLASGSGRRLKKPVRLHATFIAVLGLLTMTFSLILHAAKSICYAIVPEPVKQFRVKPWLIKIVHVRFHYVKEFMYEMFSRWHIFRSGGVIATLN